jgi:4-amino-4-deoxy-L-arabinose transferase-like glycosyltransferase
LQRSFNAKQPWLWLFLILSVFYFVGLGQLPLLGPDEPRYAQVAREMFENRDLVTPTLGHHTWFEKPALYYWLTIAAYRVFGVSEGSARIASAFSGVLTALFAFLLGGFAARRSNGALPEWFGALAGVVTASCCGLIGFSRGASFDIVLTMALASALSCLLAYEIEPGGRYKRWLLAGFYVGIGLSLLAKGLVGIVLPGGIVISYYLIQRRWPRRELWLSLLWGAPIALAVAASWYVPVIKRHGWTFIDEFFVQHHFARYISNKFHHPQPFYFYFGIVLLLVLPWHSFLVGGIARLKSSRLSSENPVSKFDAFALAWFVFPLLFFSISSSKLPGYILPAVPGPLF